MMEYAVLTGLSPASPSPQRYLWTDAFAVCNFLELYSQTSDEHYKHLALSSLIRCMPYLAGTVLTIYVPAGSAASMSRRARDILQ
jgi:Mor family transcriptional regulator